MHKFTELLKILELENKKQRKFVRLAYSNNYLVLLKFLVREGIISGYFIKESLIATGYTYILVKLKYDSKNKGLMDKIKLISTPSRPLYCRFAEIQSRFFHKNIIVLTSRGILSKSEVWFFRVGGIVLCTMD